MEVTLVQHLPYTTLCNTHNQLLPKLQLAVDLQLNMKVPQQQSSKLRLSLTEQLVAMH